MRQESFVPLNLALLTVSDTRGEAEDSSGGFLKEALEAAGHRLADRQIAKDDIYQIRALVSRWIADPGVQGILVNGGTGFGGRDSTPEAVAVLLDKEVAGFGELFRQLSYEDIGSSTVQSRALAGLANQTFIACLPGSTGACKLAWDGVLREQLDSRHRPCNFASLVAG